MLQIAHLIIYNTELLCTRNNVLCLSEAFQDSPELKKTATTSTPSASIVQQ